MAPIPPAPSRVRAIAARTAKHAGLAGLFGGVAYVGFRVVRHLLARRSVEDIADRYENLCGGDPPCAVFEDRVPSDTDDSDDESDSVTVRAALLSAPTPPGATGAEPSSESRRRSRRKTVREVPYYQPYGADRHTIRGAYLPRLVASLRARNSSLPYTRTNRMQVERMAFRMMSEHGMRAFDIQANIKRVALAVFFVTEDDLEFKREEQLLQASGRLNMNGA
jgi:hypothetical protein